MKAMKSVDELIEHMKAKGIQFNEISEDEAKKFLTSNNYYFKLSAYRANYPKCPSNSRTRAGQYENLDFAYLKELSIIDKYLRYYVVQMCLDIEHAIKVRLVESVSEDGQYGKEDGYRVVKEFLKDPDRFRKNDRKGRKDSFAILKTINAHKAGEYCKDLYNKYYPYFPVWVLVEMISFGDLIRFTAFYDNLRLYEFNQGNRVTSDNARKKPEPILINGKFMNIIRDLRNASAHSNCLINKAWEPMDKTKQPDVRISDFIKNLDAVSNDSRKKYLRINFTYNMAVLFYAYTQFLDPESCNQCFLRLQDFLNGRVIKHKDYFKNNPKLVGVYGFLKKVVDRLADNE